MTDADSTDPVARQQLARDIRDACINVGFLYVKNHGIPEESITGAVEAGKKFFALPDETKFKVYTNNLSIPIKAIYLYFCLWPTAVRREADRQL